MRMVTICLILIILLAVISLIFLGAKSKWKFDAQILSAIATFGLVIVTVALVVITWCYAIHTRGMVEAMRQSNRINYRPYVMIDALPPDIAAQMIKSPTNIPGYLVMLDQDDNETFHYYLKSIGKVPAHEVKIKWYKVREIAKDTNDGRVIEVPHKPAPPIPMYPGQVMHKIFRLGQALVFRDDPQNKRIQLTLHIIYEGIKDIDSNTYYTEHSWDIIPGRSPDDPNFHIEFAGMKEGIEKP